ncbi:hypothetical protein IFM89_030761, partial [Coptis chinensis]
MDLHKKSFLFTGLCLLAFGEFAFSRGLDKGNNEMLASWFRLKYPHIALGAWASSAPVLYYLGDTKRSWDLIDGIGSNGNRLKELSQKFKSCSLLKSSIELKDYLQRKYQDVAQYDSPEDTPVEKICSVIDAMSTNFDVLSRIFAGKVYLDIVGSAYYAAPEVLGRSYGKDIDVWSARDLVKKILTWDPKKRINLAQALRLRESIEDVNRLLEAKENALDGLQHSLFEKEQ